MITGPPQALPGATEISLSGFPWGKGQSLWGSVASPKCHLAVIKISKELMKLSPLPFYSSVTTTKLDEMAPCSSNLRPILLPPTPILSFKQIRDPEDPQANGVSNCPNSSFWPVPQRVLLLPGGWGHNQFNLHASETSPLNKIKCFPTPAWCSVQRSSSPFALRALMSTQPERRRPTEEVPG